MVDFLVCGGLLALLDGFRDGLFGGSERARLGFNGAGEHLEEVDASLLLRGRRRFGRLEVLLERVDLRHEVHDHLAQELLLFAGVLARHEQVEGLQEGRLRHGQIRRHARRRRRTDQRGARDDGGELVPRLLLLAAHRRGAAARDGAVLLDDGGPQQHHRVAHLGTQRRRRRRVLLLLLLFDRDHFNRAFIAARRARELQAGQVAAVERAERVASHGQAATEK